MSSRFRALLTVAAAALMLLASCLLGGCGDSSPAVAQSRGDTTTREAVVAALEGTGFEIRYRRAPHLQGYEVVAGEAVSGSHRVGFAVEIELADGTDAANPQPAVVPYDVRGESTVEGNVRIRTQPLAPARVGRGFELEPSRAEQKMEIKLGIALNRLFAPGFREGI